MPRSTISAPKEMRFRWCRQVGREGRTAAETCRIFGISRKTCHKRHRRNHGWEPKVRRPRRMRPQTKPVGKTLVEMMRAKRLHNCGPREMSVHLGNALGVRVSPNAAYKQCLRRGLVRRPRKVQARCRPMKAPCAAAEPGENARADVKCASGSDGRRLCRHRFADTVVNVRHAMDMPERNGRSTIAAPRLAEREPLRGRRILPEPAPPAEVDLGIRALVQFRAPAPRSGHGRTDAVPKISQP